MSAGGPSDVPVMTKTFSATLVATELLLLGLLERRRADAVVDAIVRAADHAEAAIADAEPMADELADELADAEHIFVVGSGLAHIAAMESALKLKEMAIVHAEGTETWEMASGVATIVGPASVVIAIAPVGPGSRRRGRRGPPRRRMGRSDHRGRTGADHARIDASCRCRRTPSRTTRRSPRCRRSPGWPTRSPGGAATTPTGPTGSSATTARVSATSSASRRSADADRARGRRIGGVHPEPAGRHPVVSGAAQTAEIVLHDIDPDRLRTAERMAAYVATAMGATPTCRDAPRSAGGAPRRRRRHQHHPGGRRDRDQDRFRGAGPLRPAVHDQRHDQRRRGAPRACARSRSSSGSLATWRTCARTPGSSTTRTPWRS